MKKSLCLLIIMILFTVCSAYADQHMEIQSYSPAAEGSNISIDLYEQGSCLTTVSSLFPEYAIQVDRADCFSLNSFYSICFSGKKSADNIIRRIDNLFMLWLRPKLSDDIQGIYDGNLFYHATTEQSAKTSFSELKTYFLNSSGISMDSKTETFCHKTISFFLKSVCFWPNDIDPIIYIKSFDHEKWLNMIFMDGNDVLMTISADRSSSESRRILISHKEQDKYYFRDIAIDNKNESFIIGTKLLNANTSSFTDAENDSIIYEDLFSLNDVTEGKSNFEYRIKYKRLSAPIILSGETDVSPDNQVLINGFISLDEDTAPIVSLQAEIEQMIRPVSFDDKIIVKNEDKNKLLGISHTATGIALQILAEIMPSLPQDFQTIIIKLIEQ